MIEQLGGRKGFDKYEDESVQRVNAEATAFAEQKPEVVTWVTDFVDKVDLNALQEITLEYARKSGVSKGEFNTIPRARFLVVAEENDSYPCTYNPVHNSILVNGTYIEHNINNPKIYEKLYYYLCHELVHAAGANWLMERGDATIVQVGYGRDIFPEKRPRQQAFRLLNEGMTEIIARDLMVENLRRMPTSLAHDRVLSSTGFVEYMEGLNDLVRPDYMVARDFVESINAFFAKACSVPEDVMKQALTRSYFEGTGFFSAEAEQLFAETLGMDFLSKLAKAESFSDMIRLMSSLKTKPVHRRIVDVILRALKIR